MSRLAISLFGPLRVTLDGEPVTGFESDKVRALLAYLAVEIEVPHRREKLAGLLWPDQPERSARANLRHVLASLRKALGDRARSKDYAPSGDRAASPPFLHVSRQTIQFNPASDAWVDVSAFTDLLQAKPPAHGQTIHQLEEAVELVRGAFLEGFSLAGCPAFEEWALFEGERLQRLAMEALERLSDWHEKRGSVERALEYAWRQMELEPWREEAHQQVMRLLALGGQRSAALAQYETCRRVLVEELGVPQSVRVAIQSRLKALPAQAQETLRLAAILGREFEFDILAEASDQEEGELIEALEDAERAQLIEEVSAEAGGTFALVHGLIASALIESTRTLQRRQLHRRVAAAIEARRPGDGSRLEALAHHYSEAGEGDKAAHYFLQAGDRARGLCAYQEAIDHYQQAVRYLKEQAARSDEPERDLGRAARTLMKLGLTHHNALEFEAAHQAYEEGFALWQRAGEVEPTIPPPPAPHSLRVNLHPQPRALDPITSAHRSSYVAVEQLFSGLVELTPEMDVVPGVARTWEVSEGGRKYVFHLRDDVQWSDGVPVTAGDFEYAWKWRLDPATVRPNHSVLYDIKGARAFHLGQVSNPGSVAVRALDQNTLVVELEEPAAYFLQLLAGVVGFPVPRHVVEAHGEAWTATEKFVSNGPFRLESWQPGRSLVLARNPTYHRRFRGNIQRVEWSSPAEPSDLLESYEAGSVDIAFQDSQTGMEMGRFWQRHAGDYVSTPAVATVYLGFDVSSPPFDDPRVRRAFVLATDRDTLANVVRRGISSPARGGFIPPRLPGHAPGIGLPYDPDGAHRLLAEAGYPGGSGFPTIELFAPQFREPQVAYLQQQWRRVLGVEINWKPMEMVTLVHKLDREPPGLFLAAWKADYPDPDNFLRVAPSRRYTRWHNQAYDRLLEQARGLLDQRERLELYRQAEQILVEEAPILPLFYTHFHLLIKPWVTKYPISPMGAWFWKDVILEPH